MNTLFLSFKRTMISWVMPAGSARSTTQERNVDPSAHDIASSWLAVRPRQAPTRTQISQKGPNDFCETRHSPAIILFRIVKDTFSLKCDTERRGTGTSLSVIPLSTVSKKPDDSQVEDKLLNNLTQQKNRWVNHNWRYISGQCFIYRDRQQ